MCAGMFDTPAVEMKFADDGFLRPRHLRVLTGEETTLFKKVCPGLSLSHPQRDSSFEPLWGPVKTVAAGYATDDEVRFKGSSGGSLSALAIHLLETNAVQGVLHIAPSATSPFENVVQISTNRSDVLAAAGSRYAPASPLAQINDCVKSPDTFAFIGKPCDVAALRALGRERPEVAAKFPYLLSFMCAGTPSLKGTEAVVKKMGLATEDVVHFRYRGNGWPGMARAETADGRSAEMDYDASWGTVLNQHLQFRCKICPDGTGEFADISCADAWYGDDKGYPTFVESAGRSLILGRTPQGTQLLQDAAQSGALQSEPLQLKQVERMQPYQATRKKALLARLLGLRLAFKAIPSFSNMGLRDAAKTMPAKLHAKNALGTWLRVSGLKR